MSYGGYLPLELPKGKEYHRIKKEYLKRLNSGRTAIYDVLTFLNPKTVWVPHYICDTVLAVIEQSGCKYKRYFIQSDFSIKNREDLPIEENDCMILVNYFGLTEEVVRQTAEEFPHVNLIIDNTQAFFAKPILKKGVFNIYSARKFVGTSDGAYLVAKEMPDTIYEKDFSSDRAKFLLTCLERGTEYSYQESKENEELLFEKKEMSELTKRILQGANYKQIKKRRQENFKILERELSTINRLSMPLKEQVPYFYPLLIHKDIRKDLVDEKLYIPVLWQELRKKEYVNTREWELSEYMLCMPIDQRYGKKEMSKIAEIIKKRVN